jgi:hypothetical protein
MAQSREVPFSREAIKPFPGGKACAIRAVRYTREKVTPLLLGTAIISMFIICCTTLREWMFRRKPGYSTTTEAFPSPFCCTVPMIAADG